MNIAYFSHYFVPEIGAPSARIYDLSHYWLAAGNQVEVVTCFPNHPNGKLYPGYTLQKYRSETIDGIKVHRNWSYITQNKGFVKKTIGHISLWPSASWHSIPRLKNPEIAIGTSPTFFAAMAAIHAARHFNIPFVMEVRDLWPAIFVELGVLNNKALIGILERWELWMYRRATKIVTVTNAFRENLIDRGINPSKVHVIPNGADTDYWIPRSKPLDLQSNLGLNGKFVILYIGAHGISQALHSVVSAAEILRDRKDIHFLFVGDGADKEMLLQMARDLQLLNITFHDPVPKVDVNDFYALSDVCLIPLRDIPLFETFIPSKMFEIMAMERPIIGSVQGEAADILHRSGGALVIPPENSEALANAVLELFENEENRHDMGKKGRQFVEEHYSRSILAEIYKVVLSDAITEHNL